MLCGLSVLRSVCGASLTFTISVPTPYGIVSIHNDMCVWHGIMQDAAGSSWPMNISGWTNDSSPCDNPIWSYVVCEPQLNTTINVSVWMEVVTAFVLSDVCLQVG